MLAALAALAAWPAAARGQANSSIVVEDPDGMDSPVPLPAASRPAPETPKEPAETPVEVKPLEEAPRPLKPEGSKGAYGSSELERLVPITRQVNAKPEGPPTYIPPEGKQTVMRRAKLERNAASGWSMLRFEDTPGKEKLATGWVLPSRLLEKMEDIAARDAKTVFEVSCDNTTYDDRCFVMLRVVRVAPTAAPLPPLVEPAGVTQTPPAPESPPAPDSRPAASRPSSRPTTRRAVGPSAREVMAVLAREKLGAPVVAQDRRATAGEAPRVAAPTREQPDEALLEHTRKLVINRRALLVPTGSGAWKELRFYDDNNLQAPPLRVLPSALLKRAESFPNDMAITGEITVYRGRQYIYLHSAEPILPLDRF